jgi:DNA-binding transcriptional LysR family regulator
MQWSDRIGRRLKPRDLHVFLAVAEQGNMAKAAERLAISRPVVSKTIADLEHTLGVRLLDRMPQGVEPTMYGRALLKRSLAVFDELRQSVQEIEFLSDPNSSELRVGCSEVMSAGFVGTAIAQLSRRFPRLAIRTELGTVTQQFSPLRERRCELFVCRAFVAAPEPDTDREALFYDWPLVAVGQNSKWAKSRKIRLVDLKGARWIVAQGEAIGGGQFAEVFQGVGLSAPRPTILSDSLNLRRSLLAQDDFVTIVPGSVLHFGPKSADLKILPIKLRPWKLPICMTKLKGRTLGPAATLFEQCARELARSVDRSK